MGEKISSVSYSRLSSDFFLSIIVLKVVTPGRARHITYNFNSIIVPMVGMSVRI